MAETVEGFGASCVVGENLDSSWYTLTATSVSSLLLLAFARPWAPRLCPSGRWVSGPQESSESPLPCPPTSLSSPVGVQDEVVMAPQAWALALRLGRPTRGEEVLIAACQFQSFLLGLLLGLTLTDSPLPKPGLPFSTTPSSYLVHTPFEKGEHPRSTVQGSDPWIWADALGRGWDKSQKGCRNNFARRGSVRACLPPRVQTTAFLAPPSCAPTGPLSPFAPSLLFGLKPLFCICHLCLFMPYAVPSPQDCLRPAIRFPSLGPESRA